MARGEVGNRALNQHSPRPSVGAHTKPCFTQKLVVLFPLFRANRRYGLYNPFMVIWGMVYLFGGYHINHRSQGETMELSRHSTAMITKGPRNYQNT